MPLSIPACRRARLDGGRLGNEEGGLRFEWHVGIDYSGAATPRSRQTGLAVYAARDGQEPERVVTPASPGQRHWNWNRAEIATWLIKLAEENRHFIAGIDHAFSMPIGYFSRYGLGTWDQSRGLR